MTLNVWSGNTSAEKFYEKMGMKTKKRQMEYILNKKDGEELKQKINEEYKVGCICFIIIYIEIKVRI